MAETRPESAPEHHLVVHEPSGWRFCGSCHLDWPCHGYADWATAEIELLRSVVRQVHERTMLEFHASVWHHLSADQVEAVHQALNASTEEAPNE